MFFSLHHLYLMIRPYWITNRTAAFSFDSDIASPTLLERIRQPSLKKGLPSRGGLSDARHQPGNFTLALIVRAANTREVAKELSSQLYPTGTGCTGLQFTSSRAIAVLCDHYVTWLLQDCNLIATELQLDFQIAINNKVRGIARDTSYKGCLGFIKHSKS